MDLDVQVGSMDNQYSGFVDEMYSSFLGIHGKKYYAQKREESAKAEAAAEQQASAERQRIADQLKAESEKKAAEAEKPLQEAQNN